MSSAPRAVGFHPVVSNETYAVSQISPAQIPLPRSPPQSPYQPPGKFPLSRGGAPPSPSLAPTGRGAPVPATHGRISPRSVTPATSEEAFGEDPRGVPGPGVSGDPTGRDIPVPETSGNMVSKSVTTPTEFGEEPRGAPIPGMSRASTTARGGPEVPRFPSGPGALEYDDAERARQERSGEIARQLADETQGAEESEMRPEHDFQEKQAERDQKLAEKQTEWDRRFQDTVAHYSLPGSASPEEMLEMPERAGSVIASIRASTESAASYADDIRGIVQGEREEMVRQLQAEREEARAEKEALEQQVLAERQRADDERDARMRELEKELARVREEACAEKEALEQQVLAERQRADDERDARMRELEELARVRAELDQERQQRNYDEEMRRETDSQRNFERDGEMRQQISEITNLLLAHREEFARKQEAVDERWNEKLRWRDETNHQFQGLCNMVQSVMDSCAEQKERCEQERLAAEQKPCN